MMNELMYVVAVDWSVSLTALLLIVPTGWLLARLRVSLPRESPVVKVLTAILVGEYAIYIMGFYIAFPLMVIHNPSILGIAPWPAYVIAFATIIIAPIGGLISFLHDTFNFPIPNKVSYTLFMVATIFAFFEFILVAPQFAGLPTLGQLLQMLGVQG